MKAPRIVILLLLVLAPVLVVLLADERGSDGVMPAVGPGVNDAEGRAAALEAGAGNEADAARKQEPVASARETSDVAPEETGFGGRVRVARPGSWGVRDYLGEGTIDLAVEGLAPRAVPIEGGRFSLRAPLTADVAVSRVVLQGLEVMVHEEDRVLAPGDEQVVRSQWPARAVRLSVIDRETRAHLGGVRVWDIGEAVRGDTIDPMDFDVHAGPEPDDDLLVDGVTSPFSLEIEAGGGYYWISCPGYRPYCYRFPAGRPLDQVVAPLERGGSIDVRVEDWHEGLLSCVVRLHRMGGAEQWNPRDLVAEHQALPALRMDGIPAGRYEVSLEEESGFSTPKVVCAVGLDLADRETGTVVLHAMAEEDSTESGGVTFRFEVVDAGGKMPEQAKVVPASRAGPGAVGAAVLSVPGGGWDGTMWGPLVLAPGSYRLHLQPGAVHFSFRVEPGETTTHRVPVYTLVEATITVVDGATREPVPLDMVRWSAPMNFAGDAVPGSTRHGLSVRNPTNPFTLRAPRTAIVLDVSSGFSGWRIERVDLGKSLDPVIELHNTLLEIELRGLDEVLVGSWIEAIELRQAGETVEVSASGIMVANSVQTGMLHLPVHGTLEVLLPPLPSYGALAPRTVHVEVGGTAKLVIDAAEFFADSSSAGR